MNLQDPDLFRERALIGGAWTGTATLQVNDPATGQVMGRVPECSADKTAEAIAAAEAAFRTWRRVPNADRAAALMRWHDLMIAQTPTGSLLTRTRRPRSGRRLPSIRRASSANHLM